MTAPKKVPNRRKTSGKTSGPRLVKQGHGGALLSGGVKGHKGAGGRPPSKIRERCRDSFEDRLPFLEGIVDDGEERTSDRLKAHELLGRFGGVTEISLTVGEQPEEVLTPDQRRARVAEAWERIERVKSIEELEELVTKVAKEQAATSA